MSLRCALSFVFAMAALPLLRGPTDAAQAPTTLEPAPPGEIITTTTVDLAGDAKHGAFIAVASRTRLAAPLKSRPALYQPYLSVYRQSPAGAYERIYQSPGDDGGLLIVPRSRQVASEPPMFMPVVTELRLAGVGEFLGDARQQLVVDVHVVGADCGLASVHVLTLTADGTKLRDALVVQNPCGLTADVARGALDLSGPYYAPNAPLCCPTKARARASVRFTDGRWVQQPTYFTMLPGGARPAPTPAASPAPSS